MSDADRDISYGSEFLGYLYNQITEVTQQDVFALLVFILSQCCDVYFRFVHMNIDTFSVQCGFLIENSSFFILDVFRIGYIMELSKIQDKSSSLNSTIIMLQKPSHFLIKPSSLNHVLCQVS